MLLNKVPGPNGLPTVFYKRDWEVIETDVCATFECCWMGFEFGGKTWDFSLIWLWF